MRGLPKHADPVAFRAISKAGFDLNARDHQGLPPLLTLEKSTWSNDWKEDNFSTETYRKIFKILKDAGMDMNITDPAGRTILYLLIEGHARKLFTLELFLELGCDPLARDHRGATVLHYVIRRSSNISEMMDLFVRHDVDPLTADHDRNTLVQEIVINSRHIAFSYQEDKVSIFNKKLQMLRDPGVPTDSKNRAGQIPLHLSCAIWRQAGWGSRFVGVFLKGDMMPRSDVHAVDFKGATPLHHAAVTCEATTKQLLDAGADPRTLTYEGLSPLMLAARSSQPKIVRLFLQEYKTRGVLDYQVKMKHTAWPRRTALHYACASGSIESVRFLIEAGSDPNVIDMLGFSPLHALAEFSQDDEGRKWHDRSSDHQVKPVLGSLGIALNDPTVEGNPSAMSDARAEKNVNVSDIIEILTSAEHGNVEMVKELRKRGLSSAYPFREKLWETNRVEADVEKLLQICKETGSSIQERGRRNRRFTELTVKSKVERLLRNAEYDLLHEFISRSEQVQVEALNVLANRGYAFLLEGLEDAEERTILTFEEDSRTTTHTLLGAACQSETPNLEVINVLLEKGKIYINAPFGLFKSDTALSILSKGQYFWNIEALAYLLSHGAEMESEGNRAMAPISIAAASQSVIWKNDIIETLLSHGADPNKPSAGGLPPLAYADTVDTIRLLLAHGADLALSGPAALMSAVHSLQMDSVKALLEAGVNPNIPTTSTQNPVLRYLLYDTASTDGHKRRNNSTTPRTWRRPHAHHQHRSFHIPTPHRIPRHRPPTPHLALVSIQEVATDALLLLGTDPVVRDPKGRSPWTSSPRLFSPKALAKETAQTIPIILSNPELAINACNPQGNTASTFSFNSHALHSLPFPSSLSLAVPRPPLVTLNTCLA
ncbi:hypothetical protein GRF29_106g264309 [Pseudopithomyces chartarum]|uniref:Ankyrin n=1 Tax=Pseudopithomyces chartarum TaxID=1892770 RepID=A0AAN6LTS8_9PLEO|nr:hypothetical protein GRF29_106g264309 [Pseudopithomyces chartarum]